MMHPIATIALDTGLVLATVAIIAYMVAEYRAERTVHHRRRDVRNPLWWDGGDE